MRRKKTPNGYSLPQLRTALAPLCKQSSMTTPSLITLKGWSARGEFSTCTSLAQACNTSIKKMLANATRYTLTEEKTCDAAKDAWQSEKTPQKSAISRTSEHHSKQDNPPPKSSLDAINSRIEKIELMLKQLIDGETAKRSAQHNTQSIDLAPGQTDPALLAAIDQIDGVRKYMMVRLDNEVHMLRQLHGTTGLAGGCIQPQQNSAPDNIDLQRLLSKLNLLSNIHDRLGAVEQILNKK